ENLATTLALYEERIAASPRARLPLQSIVHGRYTLLHVVPRAQPNSPDGQRLIRQVRQVPPPPGSQVLSYGQAATLYDFVDSLRTRVWWMLGIVALSMFAVLFIAFRSLVQPLNAILMTTLSLTASFGAIVFIFQDGRLQSLLHYEATGTIDAMLPVL